MVSLDKRTFFEVEAPRHNRQEGWESGVYDNFIHTFPAPTANPQDTSEWIDSWFSDPDRKLHDWDRESWRGLGPHWEDFPWDGRDLRILTQGSIESSLRRAGVNDFDAKAIAHDIQRAKLAEVRTQKHTIIPVLTRLIDSKEGPDFTESRLLPKAGRRGATGRTRSPV